MSAACSSVLQRSIVRVLAWPASTLLRTSHRCMPLPARRAHEPCVPRRNCRSRSIWDDRSSRDAFFTPRGALRLAMYRASGCEDESEGEDDAGPTPMFQSDKMRMHGQRYEVRRTAGRAPARRETDAEVRALPQAPCLRKARARRLRGETKSSGGRVKPHFSSEIAICGTAAAAIRSLLGIPETDASVSACVRLSRT